MSYIPVKCCTAVWKRMASRSPLSAKPSFVPSICILLSFANAEFRNLEYGESQRVRVRNWVQGSGFRVQGSGFRVQG